MYTSYGKANDRFGFDDKGVFRCAYKNDRLIAIIGALIIFVWIVLIIINIVSFWSYIGSGKAMMYDIGNIEELDRKAASSKGNLIDTADEIAAGGYDALQAEAHKADGSGSTMLEGFSSGFLGMSINSITTLGALIILVFLLAAFIIILIILHSGQKYTFRATDEGFTVVYPEKMHRTITLKYDDILGITWETRKFPLIPECYDFTIKTRTYGLVEFRVILHKLARVNGITETPFNYIREKIGAADPDERYLINRGLR